MPFPFLIGELIECRGYRGIILKRLENKTMISYRKNPLGVAKKYKHNVPFYKVHWFNNYHDELSEYMYHDELTKLNYHHDK